jgi:hypothetical protein
VPPLALEEIVLRFSFRDRKLWGPLFSFDPFRSHNP